MQVNVKTINNKPILYLESENKNKLAKYALEYLASARNKNFLNWQSFNLGLEKILYIDISEFTSLKSYLEDIKLKEVKTLIINLAKALDYIDKSILNIENIYLDLDYIFLDQAKELYFIYIPFVKSNFATENQEKLAKLLYLLINHLINLDKNKKHIEFYQKLLLAAKQGYKEVILLLREKENKKDKREQKNKLNFKAKLTKLSTKINAPSLVLALAIFVLILMYSLDYLFSGLSIYVLIILLALLVLLLAIEFILLFSKHSPYQLNKEKETAYLEPQTEKEEYFSDKLNLHPLNSNRILAIDLIAGSIPNLNEEHFDVFATEFIIGSSKETCDLFLDIYPENQQFLRILQRAGTFYLESLSKDIDIRLDSRLMQRYQEYELSSDCSLELGNLYFKLKVK